MPLQDATSIEDLGAVLRHLDYPYFLRTLLRNYLQQHRLVCLCCGILRHGGYLAAESLPKIAKRFILNASSHAK